MSELISADNSNPDFRRLLLATASTLVLMSSLYVATEAMAEDTDRPTVWIELGGQLERLGGTGDRFIAPFMALTPTPDPYKFASPVDAVRAPRNAFGGEGKISFDPAGTNWVFSAAIRYGRSNGNKTAKHQTEPPVIIAGANATVAGPWPLGYVGAQFVRTFAKQSESHLALDFMVGKDVGLGIFGRDSSAVVNVGVRYAQFQAKSDIKVYARPHVDVYNSKYGVPPGGFPYFPVGKFHEYTMFANSSRQFHGIGPSVSWEASVPLAGDPDGVGFAFDWGANAALLFGRQKADIHRQTSGAVVHARYPFHYTSPYSTHNDRSQSHSVTVPNVGGFAALSVKFPNAKVSLGYRGDFFFGANDAGIDARDRDTLSYHGPFATISIGLGGEWR